MCQSQDLAPQVVFQPWVSSHTNWPPATHVVGFVWSASNGATNRGAGSHGLGVYVNAEHAGEISRYAGVVPSERPPFVVSAMSRSTYAFTAWSPFAWSTMLS